MSSWYVQRGAEDRKPHRRQRPSGTTAVGNLEYLLAGSAALTEKILTHRDIYPGRGEQIAPILGD
jgi:hypothetical protein